MIVRTLGPGIGGVGGAGIVEGAGAEPPPSGSGGVGCAGGVGDGMLTAGGGGTDKPVVGAWGCAGAVSVAGLSPGKKVTECGMVRNPTDCCKAARTMATSLANCLLRSPLVRQASPIAKGRPVRSRRSWRRASRKASVFFSFK